jgi:hypothetical protein
MLACPGCARVSPRLRSPQCTTGVHPEFPNRQIVSRLDRVGPACQVVLDMVTESAEVAEPFANQVALAS